MTEEIDRDLYKEGVSCNAYEYCILYKSLKNENDRLKQENERLKELKCKFKEYCTCDTERYRKALEEIKETVNEPCIGDEDCYTCTANCPTKDILRKIDEVLKED